MKCNRLIVLSVMIFLILPISVYAVPAYLNHQGHILESDNSPVTGSVNVTFKLYSQATGGSHAWTQTMAVTFSDGYYTVDLGPGTPSLSTDLFDGSDLYLGIALEGQEEFAPRHRITSVPYAMRAGSVTGEVNATDGLSVNGEEVIDSSGMISVDNIDLSGDVGFSGTVALPHSDLGSMPSASEDNKGQLFYATDEDALYYSDGTQWVNVGDGGSGEGVITPNVVSVSPGQIELGQDVTMTINGSNFDDGSEVLFNGVSITPVTFVNAGQLTVPSGDSLASGVYSVRIINLSGLRGTLDDAFIVDGSPEWVTEAGQLGRVSDHASGDLFALEVTDPEGQDLTFELTEGALPPGLSLDQNTGVISGDPEDVSEDTEATFQITVNDTAETPHSVARDFSIVVGTSTMPITQHKWRDVTNVPVSSEWVDITGSAYTIHTGGVPLEIELSIPLYSGEHSTCRPMIDGSWAGDFESLPKDYIWHEGLTRTNYSGDIHRMWDRIRVYYDIPAGEHTVSVQCRTNSGTLAVGRTSTDALIITREIYEPNRVYQKIVTTQTTTGVTQLVKFNGTDLTVETSGAPLEIIISLPIGHGGHAGCLEWMDDALIPASPAYSNSRWHAGLETTYNGWTMWTHKRTYTGISAGSHTFSIRCYNDAGTLQMGHPNMASLIIVKEIDETNFASTQSIDEYANGWEVNNLAAGTWRDFGHFSATIDVQRGNLDIFIHTDYYQVDPGQYFTCRPLIDGQWAGSFAGLSWDHHDQEGGERQVYGGDGHHGMWNRGRIYTDIPTGSHTVTIQCDASGGNYYAGYYAQGSLLVRDVDVLLDN